eukprot:g32661.t1
MLADPNSYRFVWWEGALRALPAGPADAVFGDFLSWPGKIRAGLGAVGLKDGPGAAMDPILSEPSEPERRQIGFWSVLAELGEEQLEEEVPTDAETLEEDTLI